MSDTVVIVNPQSRSGATGRRIAELERLLDRHLGPCRLWQTAGPGDGEKLAARAREEGAHRVVVAGGDGTVSEVLSGLLPSGSERCDTELAVLPLGTGSDFARLLGTGRDLEAALTRLAAGRRRRVDVGRLVCRGRTDEGDSTRVFLNIASLGLTGTAMEWMDELGRRGKRGRLSYVHSGLVAVMRHRPGYAQIRIDGELVHEGPLTLAAIANGRYFGDGMPVAPHAEIDDGLFDVVIVGGMSRLGALACFPRLARGRHLSLPAVSERRGRVVEVDSRDPTWVEADGELAGRLPVRAQVLAGAITLVG